MNPILYYSIYLFVVIISTLISKESKKRFIWRCIIVFILMSFWYWYSGQK